eukprot:g17075.t1
MPLGKQNSRICQAEDLKTKRGISWGDQRSLYLYYKHAEAPSAARCKVIQNRGVTDINVQNTRVKNSNVAGLAISYVALALQCLYFHACIKRQ